MPIGNKLGALILVLATVVAMNAMGDFPLDNLVVQARERFGVRGEEAVLDWRETMQGAHHESVYRQLEVINTFFNDTIHWDDDLLIWGEKDYWATPLESLGERAGDCDDYSIAKYVSLVMLGIPAEQLRITYVKATLPNGFTQAHMVLAYYPSPNGVPLILDNMNPDLLPASQRQDLSPVFSFNSLGVWVGNNSTPAADNPQARISRWRDVLTRLQNEGIVL